MIKNGAEVVHLATGLIVGYPPCPRIEQFKNFIETNYKLKVVYGTHPIPEKYLINHEAMGTWKSPMWQKIIEPTMATKEIRIAYN